MKWTRFFTLAIAALTLSTATIATAAMATMGTGAMGTAAMALTAARSTKGASAIDASTIASPGYALPIDAELSAKGNELKTTMKQVGKLMKVLAADKGNPSKNPHSADVANELAALFQHCVNLIPEGVESLPADQRLAAIDEYQRLMQLESSAAMELHAAFTANDNVNANVILEKMNRLKIEGHDRFKH